MAQSDSRVLIVDDSQLDLMFVKKALNDEFDLYTASSAEEALAVINEIDPKVVLLDVKMHGMSGFELCQKIKEQEQFEHCRILFISGLESIEEKLKGFECGASDFLSKPVVPEILRKKIRVEIENHSLIKQLASEKDNFFNVAMEAITSSGEVGVVLTFTRDLFGASDEDELATLLLNSLNELGISVSLRLKSKNAVTFKSNGGPISELERKLLNNLDKAKRIHEFGRQIIFNYDSVGILVRGQIKDEATKERYKDIIALMADSTVSFLKRLARDQEMKAIGYDAQETVKSVQIARQQHQKQMEYLLLQLITDLEQTYLNWDLTEEQEMTLIDTVSRGLDSLNDHRDQGAIIEAQLDEILKRVSSVSPK